MSTNKSFSSETSERYSRALFEVAKESNEIDKVENDVRNFQLLFNSSEEIKNFLQNPTQSKNTQNSVINLLIEKLGFSKNLKNFFLLLIEKRRIFFVKKISESFLRLCSKKRGEIKAVLVSAKKLSDDEINVIKEDLSKNFNSKIKIKYKHDGSLIGGLTVQVGSVMVDTSIKNKLQQIENRMIEA